MAFLLKMISDLQTLKIFFKESVKTPIFGVGVYAFDRLGLEDVFQPYRMLALRYSLDTELIEKEIELLSLEKGRGTRHIVKPRNSTTVLTHEKTIRFLRPFKNPLIIPYKASSKMDAVCRENGWILAAPPPKFGKGLFENKVKFRRILEELRVPAPPGEKTNASDLDFELLKHKYGVPFVLQHPQRGGGKGTFFIHSLEEWEHALRKMKFKEAEGIQIKEDISRLEVIIAKYIKGPSPSITGCVTRHGILSTSPQYQIIDAPELYNPTKGSGLFCGHDWSSARFSQDVRDQAYDAVQKVGVYFQKFGYKGIFGIDFIMDEKTQKLYVTECNPRLLGSFPTITMLQVMNNEPPILAFHLLEYLGINYNIDFVSVNEKMRAEKFGSQMFVHNLTLKWAHSGAFVKPGFYKMSPKLEFLRDGYAMKHLKNKDEFLLTDGVLQKGAHYSPNRRLCRIITLRGVLSEDKKTLSPWAKNIAISVHNSFNLRHARLARFIKFFNPNYLAKG